MPSRISSTAPLAVAVVEAIRTGDLATLRRLLEEHPDLATSWIDSPCNTGPPNARSLLHIATDWPGHFPEAAATIAILLAAGADANARFVGKHAETPLHWAASSDDVAALDALLDGSADIEAPGSVIDGGSPLADAVGFGQWKAARRLVERGARTTLWQAAALGLISRVREYFVGEARPSADEITNGFWCACHGGQQSTAEFSSREGCRSQLDWIQRPDSSRCRAPQRGARRRGVADDAWREIIAGIKPSESVGWLGIRESQPRSAVTVALSLDSAAKNSAREKPKARAIRTPGTVSALML